MACPTRARSDGPQWWGGAPARHTSPVPPAPEDCPAPAPDPVLERRRRIARAAEIGQRAGYTLFGVAVGLFVYGFVVDFVPAIVNAIVVCLAVGSVLLAPAIVAGYAVKAAEREDRERDRRN